jgi:Zn-dependent metalloprotease
MYAAGEMWDMLGAWFGRNGLDGQGHAAGIGVGWQADNAFFLPESRAVILGRVCVPDTDPEVFPPPPCEPDPLGRQRSSMDVVAHEFGHMVFDTTPGGFHPYIFENHALGEGAADIFSQLTIAFANNPRVPLTYTRGSQFGEPYRIMYHPSLVGHEDCWSPDLADITKHNAYAAAGPFNHWFYLLAEGSAPVGRPASPTCDGSTLTGLGIRLAGKIFYNGLLLKTPTWQYRDARWATLTATKQLFSGSCTVFDKVKAAWNAVSVPAGPDEPTCTTPTPHLDGPVTLNSNSTITENTAEVNGGGILNSGTLVGAVAGRNVRDNTPQRHLSPGLTGQADSGRRGSTRRLPRPPGPAMGCRRSSSRPPR